MRFLTREGFRTLELIARVESKDIHKLVATLLFDVPYAEVTDDQRRSAKIANNKYLYGGVRPKEECPFCGGSKIKPFVRAGVSQACDDCDSNGMISQAKLIEYGLREKYSRRGIPLMELSKEETS